MSLTRFAAQGIRNLESFTIDCAPQLNLFFGENAAGKTSILEALHILGTGRSFLSSRFKDIVTHGQQECLLTGLTSDSAGQIIPMGYQRKGPDVEIHINRQKVTKNSILAQHFPLQVIHPASDELILGSPGQRRRYIDWGLFHVEQPFHKAWRDYNHALKQRNAALRTRQSADLVKLWDGPLTKAGEALHSYRLAYVETLKNHVETLAVELYPEANINTEYRPGWEQSRGLADAMAQHLSRDMKQGYTGDGPHRADLRVLIGDQLAMDVVSRGQLKTLVVLLVLAQIRQFTLATGKACALLFDDIASELDAQHREKVLAALSALGTQLFISCIDPETLNLPQLDESKLRMFHVERGYLKPVS